MAITRRGAWFLHGYRAGMAGTLGMALDSDSDNLGWTLRSLKYELANHGWRGKMVLDSPILGTAYDTQCRLFQAQRGITVDGICGPVTARELLLDRIAPLEVDDKLKVVEGIVAHESSFDFGAIGFEDPFDRGATQRHLGPTSQFTLSQAIRPAYALPSLSWQLLRVMQATDIRAAVASWNIGEGSAEWWWEQGKPASGSPEWWNETLYGDMSERATRYVAAVLLDG